jgi:hypothetical protein
MPSGAITARPEGRARFCSACRLSAVCIPLGGVALINPQDPLSHTSELWPSFAGARTAPIIDYMSCVTYDSLRGIHYRKELFTRAHDALQPEH